MANFNGNETIEDIVEEYPDVVEYLQTQNIQCIVCGEPVWMSLAELLEFSGIDDTEEFIKDLNTKF